MKGLRLVFVIMGFILCIYIMSQVRELMIDKQEASLPVWKDLHNIELMAELENRMAVENQQGSSLTGTGRKEDYTTLYPELYATYDLPKKMPEGKKIAYLTFDDGPSENTYDILDILEEMDVKATFFIVGSSINKEREDCIKRMKYEGHAIGIHTYSHLCNEIYCSVERFLDDFNLVYQQLYEITGDRVNIFRFPWGSNNKYNKNIKDSLIEEMERRGFLCYDWSVDASDSIGRPTAYSIRHNIEKELMDQEYPIILMHDSASRNLTVRILPGIIRMLKDKGYEFDTLNHREPYKFEW